MRTAKNCLLALIIGTAMTTGSMAADEIKAPIEKAKPGVLEAAAGSTTATVVDINYKTRSLSLKREDGNVVTMHVPVEVTRFDQIKKGDIVEVSYLASVAIMVQSPDKQIASTEGSQSVVIRNQGKKPSGMQVDTDIVTATVEKIDAKNRKATLKGPQGNTFDVDIAPDVEHLENVKKGDQVLVKVTRTVAIDVSSPKKK